MAASFKNKAILLFCLFLLAAGLASCATGQQQNNSNPSVVGMKNRFLPLAQKLGCNNPAYYDGGKDGSFLLNYIPSNENMNNWTRLVSVKTMIPKPELANALPPMKMGEYIASSYFYETGKNNKILDMEKIAEPDGFTRYYTEMDIYATNGVNTKTMRTAGTFIRVKPDLLVYVSIQFRNTTPDATAIKNMKLFAEDVSQQYPH